MPIICRGARWRLKNEDVMPNPNLQRKLTIAAALLFLTGVFPFVTAVHAQSGSDMVDSESLLDSENKDFRESAVNALCDSKGKANTTAALIKALKNSYWLVQYKAVICLGDRGRGDKDAGRALIAFLKQDDGSREKLTASTIEAIGKARPLEATWELSRYIKSSSDLVRKAAAQSMISLDDPVDLKVIVKSISATHCPDAPDSAVYTGAQYLAEQLRTGSSSQKISAMWAISQAKAGGQLLLLNLLKDPDSSIRTEAAFALGDMGSCDAITPLAEMGVSDLSAKARIAALWNIAKIKDGKTPRRDSDPMFRDTAEQTAKGLKEKAAAIAQASISSPEPEVRVGVASVALRIKNDKFEKVASAVLLAKKGEFPYPLKLEAAYQLWDFGGQTAADTFSKALGSFNPEIRIPARAAAAESLGGSKFLMPFFVCGAIFVVMLVLLYWLRVHAGRREAEEKAKMELAAEIASKSSGDAWL
ncbi:MAG: HEAT repeat domain-containing protein [Elusimicrobiaceae bacterium]|nr:HEAT repeat domain-containing protein [Elusimicrobiaceae bacterium]